LILLSKEDKMSKGENDALGRCIYKIPIVLLALLFISSPLHAAKYQEIFFTPDDFYKSIGNTFSISVMYDVSDNKTDLPGVGIRIHYDSSKLEYKGFSNMASAQASEPYDKDEDPLNTDMDASTDRMIVLAWAETHQNAWPGETLPYTLVDLEFQVNTGLSASDTTINAGFTSVAAGYYGKSENATLHITTMPMISWTVASRNIAESATTIEITADLSYATTKDVTVPITVSGTADLVTDYTIDSQTLFIGAGEETASVFITLIDDLYIEIDETIELTMGTPENALTDTPFIHTITIENIDEGHFTSPNVPSDTESVWFYGDNFTIDDEKAEIGDEIGVFDDDGILCGRFIIKEEKGEYGIEVYADNPATTDQDEGALAGEELTFKVWDLSTDTEFETTSDMLKPEIVFDFIPASEYNPPKWISAGVQRGLNIEVSSAQEILLKEGWNLFSFSVNNVYYDSSPPNVPTLSNANFIEVGSLNDALETIDGKYDLIRNSDAESDKIYSPSFPSFLNTLDYLAAGYGYWIKMREEATLRLSGARAKAADTLDLREGWNLVGYWHSDAQHESETISNEDLPDQTNTVKVDDLDDVLSAIKGQYTIIRSGDGEIYSPNFPSFLNSLDYMAPGYGYWIKMTESTTLNY